MYLTWIFCCYYLFIYFIIIYLFIFIYYYLLIYVIIISLIIFPLLLKINPRGPNINLAPAFFSLGGPASTFK